MPRPNDVATLSSLPDQLLDLGNVGGMGCLPAAQVSVGRGDVALDIRRIDLAAEGWGVVLFIHFAEDLRQNFIAEPRIEVRGLEIIASFARRKRTVDWLLDKGMGTREIKDTRLSGSGGIAQRRDG